MISKGQKEIKIGRPPLFFINEDIPGPNSYKQINEYVIRPRTAVYTFSKDKKMKFITNDFPGPGEYNIDINPFRKAYAKYTFGKEKKILRAVPLIEDIDNEIGPGQYNPIKTFNNTQVNVINIKFPLAKRFREVERDISPGVGTYDLPSYFGKEATDINFTKEKKECYFDTITKDDFTPGPGNYKPKKIKICSHSPNVARVLGKPKEIKKDDVVGVGSYNVCNTSRNVLKHSPKCCFGSEKRFLPLKKEDKYPDLGPGSYHPKYKQNNIICYKFSKDKRFKEIKNDNPGVGEYYIN